MNKRQREKKDRNFARCYHSHDRVEWVRNQPSVASGERGCENAHTRIDGVSRKASYEHIVPLTWNEHRCELPSLGREGFERKYGINLDAEAAKTQQRWIEYGNELLPF